MLVGWHLLIVIDEESCLAELKRDYTLLFGHLRSLMQSTEQPVVLLFCGTHALREGASDYQSILFNTCQTEYVSYLSEAEAHQVLTRPVDGFLVFDPQALALGFQLTAGQPYLLQLLGLKLIEQFDATLQRGEPRSNYVTYLGDFRKPSHHLAGLFTRLRCCGSPNIVHYAQAPRLEDEQKSCAIWYDCFRQSP